MSRILVCGLCPLPVENTQKIYGPGIRTWQFTRALADAGHTVRLAAMRIEDAYIEERPDGADRIGGIEVFRTSPHQFLDGDLVKNEIESFQPDAVVGANIYGSYALARWRPTMPFWADQNGHVMAEAQAKAALDGSNRVLPYFWRMVNSVLGWADRISVISERQRHAVIGELGCAGRLCHETCGYEFVEVIPNALIPESIYESTGDVDSSIVPPDAFVVLWSGSFNVWTDPVVVFEGMCIAMEKNPRIHFLSTGGAIPGHDEKTYQRFTELVASSPLRERFHLCGWVPSEEGGDYWKRADIGVLTELLMYEGELGSKNRIVQWLAYGLPVVYNRVGDLGDLLASREIGVVFQPGSAQDFAAKVLWSAEHPDEIRLMAERAKRYVEDELTFGATTQGLVEWADNPEFAPDRSIRGSITSPADFVVPAPESKASPSRSRLGSALRQSKLVRKIAKRLYSAVTN